MYLHSNPLNPRLRYNELVGFGLNYLDKVQNFLQTLSSLNIWKEQIRKIINQKRREKQLTDITKVNYIWKDECRKFDGDTTKVAPLRNDLLTDLIELNNENCEDITKEDIQEFKEDSASKREICRDLIQFEDSYKNYINKESENCSNLITLIGEDFEDLPFGSFYFIDQEGTRFLFFSRRIITITT